MRHNEASGPGLLRPQAANDGGGRRGRPWSREGQDNGQKMMDTNGEVENRLGSEENDARPRVRPRGPSGLSGFKESKGLQSNSDGSMPEEPTENFPRDKRRRGQRSPSAAQVTSTNDSGLAEAGGKRGKVGGTKRSWGAPPGENVDRTAARSKPADSSTDDAVRNTSGHRPGRRNIDSNAEKEQSPAGGHSTAPARNIDHDRFARDRPGDRYYLPPPQRNNRPRTSPDDSGSNNSSTPRVSERRRKDSEQWPRELRGRERQHGQQGQQRKASRAMPWRSGGVDDNVDSSSSVPPRRREVRTSFSSDRLYRQQPADHRPMLGASEASGASSMPDWRYGWRGSFTTTSLTQQSQEEESLPYYVDRKQVCVCVGEKGNVYPPEVCRCHAAQTRLALMVMPSIHLCCFQCS